jgi:hypothetical protein
MRRPPLAAHEREEGAMTMVVTPPRARSGTREGPRHRPWTIRVEPRPVPDAQQRLDRLYRRLLALAQQPAATPPVDRR